VDLMNTDACTLPTAERPLRQAEFDALFTSARQVNRNGCEVEIHLAGSAGLRDRVEDLAARETACCSFFAFDIEGEDGDLVLRIAVPEERRDILDALATRAEQRLA